MQLSIWRWRVSEWINEWSSAMEDINPRWSTLSILLDESSSVFVIWSRFYLNSSKLMALIDSKMYNPQPVESRISTNKAVNELWSTQFNFQLIAELQRALQNHWKTRSGVNELIRWLRANLIRAGGNKRKNYRRTLRLIDLHRSVSSLSNEN